MSEDDALKTLIDTRIIKVLKTSEIEGKYLSLKDLRSAIRNNLGLNVVAEDIKVKEAADLIVEGHTTYD